MLPAYVSPEVSGPMTFPRDDYTPFGYLANPYHRARSWTGPEAGLLRATDDLVGFGWVEPTARRPTIQAGLALAIRWNGRVYQSRADFARLGYRSRHHTAQVFSFDWQLDQVEGQLSFALADRDAIVAELAMRNPGALPHASEVFLVGYAWGRDGARTVESTDAGWRFVDGSSRGAFDFALAGSSGIRVDRDALAAIAPAFFSDGRVATGFRLDVELETDEALRVGLGLTRGAGVGEGASSRASAHRLYSWLSSQSLRARPHPNPLPGAEGIRRALPEGEEIRETAAIAPDVIAAKRAADDAFYAGVALPVGDWPDAWKRGWIYDLETTRACIFPPGGIFHRPWPSWMISWPRVVLAEGMLDAARFSYAAPEQALDLARTILADAPAANVPCVFQGGEPNMVAKDGAVCGTSPAWCLPFYNLWLLYCRTLDRAWLSDVVPHLEAYLEFWLRERIDEEGWIVYKCTWEAGEDATPRLDPAAEGDTVISHVVRPVELQATVSQSAAILARFARELGQDERERRWGKVAQDYAARTQRLWDPAAGRFRDWDKRTNAFLAAPGAPAYWKTDPVRFSALSLTPLVAGLAGPEQRERLRREIEYYDAAPWCLWPSWSFVVAEAASTAGWYDFAGRYAARIVDRVYRGNDRRTLADAPRPTPGTAPEFWPLDLAEFDGSDGYGWGATTTSLWMRQIFGFLDGMEPAELSFTLAPSLPEAFLRPGHRLGFTNLPYRGLRLDLAYEVTPTGMEAVVQCAGADIVGIVGDGDDQVLPVQPSAPGSSVRFPMVSGTAVRVLLQYR